MKHLVLGAGILVVAVAAATAPAPASPAPRGKVGSPEATPEAPAAQAQPRPVFPEGAPQGPLVRVENVRIEAKRAEPSAGSLAVSAPRPPSAGDPRRLEGVLARELELAPVQQAQVADILRERQEAIEAYHRELRASGVFRPKEYERRVGAIVDLSYSRIAQVLDAAQNRKFAELIRTGRLGDAVPFDIEPHMVVLE
ncbi:MAG: hypothetical protein ACK44W_00785 [Planctomycetota bacterium]